MALGAESFRADRAFVINGFDFNKMSKSFDAINMKFDVVDERNLSLLFDHNKHTQSLSELGFECGVRLRLG